MCERCTLDACAWCVSDEVAALKDRGSSLWARWTPAVKGNHPISNTQVTDITRRRENTNLY